MPNNILPATTLDAAIANGPQFTEDWLLSKAALPPSTVGYEKFKTLIEYASRQRTKDKVAYNFLLGHLHEEAGRSIAEKADREKHLSAAIQHYQDSTSKSPTKSQYNFYSLFHIGLIQDTLGHPWSQIEDVYLQAFETSPTRGESLEAIIRHYLSSQEWAISYIFSSFAIENFFAKIPSPTPTWGLNTSLYQWKVLDLHTAACFQLGIMDEAENTFKRLLILIETSPEIFTHTDIEKLNAKRQLFNPQPTIC